MEMVKYTTHVHVFSGAPDKQLNPKKKVWETLKPDIRTNAERVATYKGVPFKVEGKGIVKAPTLTNAEISWGQTEVQDKMQ